MPHISSAEILIVALVILLIFGNKKLQEVAKGLGETGKQLKKAKKEFTSTMDETEKDLKRTFDINGETKEPEKKPKEGEDGII